MSTDSTGRNARLGIGLLWSGIGLPVLWAAADFTQAATPVSAEPLGRWLLIGLALAASGLTLAMASLFRAPGLRRWAYVGPIAVAVPAMLLLGAIYIVFFARA